MDKTRYFLLCYFFAEKSNTKSRPKSITSRFRVGSLIKLLYYCSFSDSTLIYFANEVTSRLVVVDDK